MDTKIQPPFDPKVFLAKIGAGRSPAGYEKNQKVFSQGDSADAVFLYPERPRQAHRRLSQVRAASGSVTVDAPFRFWRAPAVRSAFET